MTRLALILATIFALIGTSARADDQQFESDKNKIKKAYSAYVNNFIANDFGAIAEKFTYPATFKIKILSFIPLTITLDDHEEMVEHFKSLRKNIQEGYSYSTVDQISVEKTQEGYVADVMYSRFNSKGELLTEGRGLYSYRDVDGHWKMYAVEVLGD